jgi:hypothetical protein
MCHIVKVMMVGDTFRMNVGDTKPYNADRFINTVEVSNRGPEKGVTP